MGCGGGAEYTARYSTTFTTKYVTCAPGARIIWCGVFAFIYALPYRLLARSGQGNLPVMAYCIFLPTSIVAFRDGTLMSLSGQLLFYLTPVVALTLLARFKLFADQLWFSMTPAPGGTDNVVPQTTLTPHARRLAAIAGRRQAADRTPATVGTPTRISSGCSGFSSIGNWASGWMRSRTS